MWPSVITALVGALAVLTGAIVNDRLSRKRQREVAQIDRVDKDRRASLDACTEFVSIVRPVRHACLIAVGETSGQPSHNEPFRVTVRDVA